MGVIPSLKFHFSDGVTGYDAFSLYSPLSLSLSNPKERRTVTRRHPVIEGEV